MPLDSALRPLAGLTQLKVLGLYNTGVTDLGPLASLTQLQLLAMQFCRGVTDLGPLVKLLELRTLILDGCTGIAAFNPFRGLLDRLEHLCLYDTRFQDLPPEVCGQEWDENVLDAVRAHYADLGFQSQSDAEVKVFILGNGRVGKTQLCRRLQGLPFDETEPTTHGVHVGHCFLTLEPSSPPVRLNLWDFGGQDIYHGSHALFLQGQAIFLILWHPDFEHGEYEENSIPLRNRPLPYWLDYIRGLAGKHSPILIIQARCDTPDDRLPQPSLPVEDFAGYVRFLECSAKVNDGLDFVWPHLKAAVRALLARWPAPPIGIGRVEVRDELRRRLDEDKQQLVPVAEFEEICADNGKVSSAAELLKFLHRTGVVFYKPELFREMDIILDQNWALEAIYTLFHREKTLRKLREDGRFTRSDLAGLIWHTYSEGDQNVFLSMMQSCNICFPVGEVIDTQTEETQYLAPDLLPGWSAHVEEQLFWRLRQDPPGAEATVRYRFLHEGILRGILARVGRQARNAAIYWKYGCWFGERTTQSQVLLEHVPEETPDRLGGGSIRLRAWGTHPARLLAPLVKELLAQPLGEPPVVTTSWKPDELERGERHPETPQPALAALEVPARPDLSDDGRPEVFISYAWEDRTPAGVRRGQVVDRLCACVEGWGYKLQIDRRVMRPGDLISGFMKRIGRGDRVIVILSEKYLRSPYCMTELHYIYERAHGEKDEFLRRIVPLVLEDAKIDTWRDCLSHARHWKAEYEEMEKALADLGTEHHREYKLMRLWHANIGDILKFLADVLAPRRFEDGDDFQAVRALLERR